MIRHPAKYNDKLIPVFADFLEGDERILDPFAGVGKIFLLRDHHPNLDIRAIEIEPEWAHQHPETQVGNALCLPFPDDYFDVIVTSPCYGNRMADHFVARDNSRRNTYRHALGRPLHPDNSGRLQWGEKYKLFHAKAWNEARRVLKDHGHFILNIKDHIRKGKRQMVTAWHIGSFIANGFSFMEDVMVETSGNRQGNNYNVRIDYESVILFRKNHYAHRGDWYFI